MVAVSHVRSCYRFYDRAISRGWRIYYRPVIAAIYPLPIHSCIATSLMIVALVSIGGIAVAVIQGATLPLPFTLWFVLSAATGMSIGRRLSQHLPEHIVQKGFSGLLIVVALGMVFNAVMMKFSG